MGSHLCGGFFKEEKKKVLVSCLVSGVLVAIIL